MKIKPAGLKAIGILAVIASIGLAFTKYDVMSVIPTTKPPEVQAQGEIPPAVQETQTIQHPSPVVQELQPIPQPVESPISQNRGLEALLKAGAK